MIVIPMAGSSRRFAVAGYDRPKYLLPIGGQTVFHHAVSSFSHYFAREPFLFVLLDIHGTAYFVQREAAALGIEDVRLVVLPRGTSGQATTVMKGLEMIECLGAEPLTIFNIDTFRQNFRYPHIFNIAAVDGFLEVFRGTGANWSYVRPDPTRPWAVAETAEKRPISDLCCTGLYYFRSAALFVSAYTQYLSWKPSEPGGDEIYVAPLYNVLIKHGLDVRYAEIRAHDVVFCGTPDEYQALSVAPPNFSERSRGLPD